MGIQLGPLLETRKIKLEELSGQSVAIDGYNVLYQFLTSIRQADGTLLTDSEGRVTSHLSGLFFRFSNLVENGLKICLVFDGKPPALKMDVLEVRRQRKLKAQVQWEAAIEAGDMETARTKAQQTTKLDATMIQESKELLVLLGIPWVQAPSEGEAQVAHLLSTGKVDYGASQDFDTVLFGASKLVRNLTLLGRRIILTISLYFDSRRTSCIFIAGMSTLVTPVSAAASIFAVTPPTGNTCPLTLKDPVKATV